MAREKDYDFSGWVTKNDLKCSDGVTIRHGAFAHNDNVTVPLVWNHDHTNPSSVIGKIRLSNRENGVYGYGKFNNTERGRDALELIQHGDIGYMSIAANEVKRTKMQDVIHGNIYEVSLVYVAANPGARIDTIIQHSEDSDEHIIFTNDMLIHAANYPDDEDDDELEDVLSEVLENLSEEDIRKVVAKAKEITGVEEDDVDKIFDALSDDQLDDLIDFIFDGEPEEEEDNEPEEKDDGDEDEEDEDFEHSAETDQLIEDILANMTEDEALDVLQHARKLVGKNVRDEDLLASLSSENIDELTEYILENYDSKLEHSWEEEEMRQRIFEKQNGTQNDEALTELIHGMAQELVHSEMKLSELYAAHADELLEHGITNIEGLFTVENDTGAPGWIRPEEPSMVAKIINKVKKTPAHTVHGRWADITEDEARARGYIKGTQKLDEVFTWLNRRTYPQTIYKKQSFDRDDLIDITDFDVIAWVKPEMQEMLKYELAMAILIGDGRGDTAAGKINEERIRPIAKDTDKDGLFVTKFNNITAANFVEQVKRARRAYKGSGKPSLYIDLQLLIEIELIKDDNGRYLYGVGNRPATDEEIAQLVGCDECISPEFMDGSGLAIMVNLSDYELACPAKGAATMFDDFDIDFNKLKYLIETRVAGALNTPKSAVVFSTEVVTETDEEESGTGD